MIRFLERCAGVFENGNAYTRAPMVGRHLQRLAGTQRLFHANHGPAHVYALARVCAAIALAASDLK